MSSTIINFFSFILIKISALFDPLKWFSIKTVAKVDPSTTPDHSNLSFFDRLVCRTANYILKSTCDIEINGQRDCDIKVNRDRLYNRMVKFTFGLNKFEVGESFIAGDWDVENLVEFSYRIYRNDFLKIYQNTLGFLRERISMNLFDHHNKEQSIKNVAVHYNLGPELYSNFLDKNMLYSCGYWRNAKNLEEAQLHKLDLIGRKLKLKKGMKVLDIGCGWGSLSKYLAETYEVEVTGVTLSEDQIDYANKHFSSDRVNIMFMDYRDLIQKHTINKDTKKNKVGNSAKDNQPETYLGYFDRIVSIEMFEHVGPKHYREYFGIVSKLLKDETSIFLLQTSGINKLWVTNYDPWVNKYYLPNIMVPYSNQIISETKNLLFIEDWHDFGFDHALTMEAWFENFKRNWPKIKSLVFEKERLYENDKRTQIRQNLAENLISEGTRVKSQNKKSRIISEVPTDKEIDEEIAHLFFRFWRFVLLMLAGMYRARRFTLWQIVFTKSGLVDGYQSER